MIKKFAHTFFFGYLETKWKRLARVLSIAFIHIFYVYACWSDGVGPLSFNGYIYLLSNYMPFYIMVINIISWVIKPFMVDK